MPKGNQKSRELDKKVGKEVGKGITYPVRKTAKDAKDSRNRKTEKKPGCKTTKKNRVDGTPDCDGNSLTSGGR